MTGAELDYLTDLYEQKERAERRGDKYESGYATGRILEYASQNALSNLDLMPAVRAANARVYGEST